MYPSEEPKPSTSAAARKELMESLQRAELQKATQQNWFRCNLAPCKKVFQTRESRRIHYRQLHGRNLTVSDYQDPAEEDDNGKKVQSQIRKSGELKKGRTIAEVSQNIAASKDVMKDQGDMVSTNGAAESEGTQVNPEYIKRREYKKRLNENLVIDWLEKYWTKRHTPLSTSYFL